MIIKVIGIINSFIFTKLQFSRIASEIFHFVVFHFHIISTQFANILIVFCYFCKKECFAHIIIMFQLFSIITFHSFEISNDNELNKKLTSNR